MRAAGILFFISWLICCSCVDAIFEDPAALIMMIASFAIASICAIRMYLGMKEGVQFGAND